MVTQGRVLVIDSDRDTLTRTLSLVSREGFAVDGAHSGDTIRSALAKGRPSVVVIEPALEGIDGFLLCRSILASYDSSPPVIVIASHKLHGKTAHLRAKEAGAYLYVERPQNDHALVDAVAHALAAADPAARSEASGDTSRGALGGSSVETRGAEPKPARGGLPSLQTSAVSTAATTTQQPAGGQRQTDLAAATAEEFDSWIDNAFSVYSDDTGFKRGDMAATTVAMQRAGDRPVASRAMAATLIDEPLDPPLGRDPLDVALGEIAAPRSHQEPEGAAGTPLAGGRAPVLTSADAHIGDAPREASLSVSGAVPSGPPRTRRSDRVADSETTLAGAHLTLEPGPEVIRAARRNDDAFAGDLSAASRHLLDEPSIPVAEATPRPADDREQAFGTSDGMPASDPQDLAAAFFDEISRDLRAIEDDAVAVAADPPRASAPSPAASLRPASPPRVPAADPGPGRRADATEFLPVGGASRSRASLVPTVIGGLIGLLMVAAILVAVSRQQSNGAEPASGEVRLATRALPADEPAPDLRAEFAADLPAFESVSFDDAPNAESGEIGSSPDPDRDERSAPLGAVTEATVPPRPSVTRPTTPARGPGKTSARRDGAPSVAPPAAAAPNGESPAPPAAAPSVVRPSAATVPQVTESASSVAGEAGVQRPAPLPVDMVPPAGGDPTIPPSSSVSPLEKAVAPPIAASTTLQSLPRLDSPLDGRWSPSPLPVADEAPEPAPTVTPGADGTDQSDEASGDLAARGPSIGVRQGVVGPLLIAGTRAEPRYPLLAKRSRMGGTIVLKATIGLDGSPVAIEVIEGPNPDYGLAEAAVAAVTQWRYRPAQLDGKPIEHEIEIRIVFRP